MNQTQQTALPTTRDRPSSRRCPIVELRQYTLHEGKRDALIELFEREFIESQEAVGMTVLGTFTDLERPDRFVWLRGFSDMEARAASLSRFYDGPVWHAHRDQANSTMIDSDNVLLLRAPSFAAEFKLADAASKPQRQAPAALVVAMICKLSAPAEDAATAFETAVMPWLRAQALTPLAWMVSEPTPNNYPRLPVREGENVLVWLARAEAEPDDDLLKRCLDDTAELLRPWLDGDVEVLRLRPTARSQIG